MTKSKFIDNNGITTRDILLCKTETTGEIKINQNQLEHLSQQH